MAQPKALLAIGAGAVVAAAVVLVIALRTGDGAPEDDAATAAPQVAADTNRRPPTANPGAPGAPVVKPSEVGDVERPDRPEVREYEIDGVKVRDHRKNPTDLKLPPNIHPPERRRISSTVVGDIHNQVMRLAPECTKDLTVDRGAKPKIEMQVVISIKDKQVKVTKGTAALSDVTGSGADMVKGCMEQKVMTIVSSAPDEPDVDDYSINLSMPYPR